MAITKEDIRLLYLGTESRGPTTEEYGTWLGRTDITTATQLFEAYRLADSRSPITTTIYGEVITVPGGGKQLLPKLEDYADQGCKLDIDNGAVLGTHAWHIAMVDLFYRNLFNKTIYSLENYHNTAEQALINAAGEQGSHIKKEEELNTSYTETTPPTQFNVNTVGYDGDTLPAYARFTSNHYGNIKGDFTTGWGKYVAVSTMWTPTTSILPNTVSVDDRFTFYTLQLDCWSGWYWTSRATKGIQSIDSILSSINMLVGGGDGDIRNVNNDPALVDFIAQSAPALSAKTSFIDTLEKVTPSIPATKVIVDPNWVSESETPEIEKYKVVAVNVDTIATASSAASVIRAITTEDAKVAGLAVTLPQPVNYQKSYTDMYADIVEVQMRSMRTQLSDLFNLIDNGDTETVPRYIEPVYVTDPITQDVTVTPGTGIYVVDPDAVNNSEALTAREKISLKKDAYMSILSQVNSNANSSTVAVLDKVSKFKYELESSAASAARLVYEAELTVTKKDVMLQQVIDNRRIKAMESLGDTYSTGMAGGLVPTAPMWAEYFRLTKELTLNSLEGEKLMQYRGVWKPSATVDGIVNPVTVEPKFFTEDVMDIDNNYKDGALNVGNYWLVDLSDWLLDAPNALTYLGKVKTGRTGTHDKNGYIEGDVGVGELLYVTDPTSTDLQVFTDVEGVVWATTPDGSRVLKDLVGTIIPASKTDIKNVLCSISLDGINYWKHGDIVYVDEIKTGAVTVTNAYRRVSGFSAGTAVTVAPPAVVGSNSAYALVN